MKTGRKRWRHRRHGRAGGHPVERTRWEYPGEFAHRYSENMDGEAYGMDAGYDPYEERRSESWDRNPGAGSYGYYDYPERERNQYDAVNEGQEKNGDKARNTRFRNSMKGYRRRRSGYHYHYDRDNVYRESGSIDEHLSPGTKW